MDNSPDIRNIRFNRVGTIDCEVNHPQYGWINFTADPTDVMPYSKEIYDRALALNPAPYVPEPEPVPQSVTPYQARIAILNAGLMDKVTALMNNPATPQAIKIAWEYATTWERTSQFIAQLAPALDLSESQIDDLFRAAAQVS